MIEKNEVLQIADALSLSPDTIEKDYVLSWMLFGIHNDADISKTWLFKGGTSLKKCFFETYRFSEDLDFTLTTNNHLTVDFLTSKFHTIADRLYSEVGIEFFKDKFKFKVLDRPHGKKYAQGKIHYNGPLQRKIGSATIKLDLSTDEIVVLKPVKQRVHHPYSDDPSDGIWANCYAFEEVIAEKVRALAQRARPRDVYDVVHFFRNRSMIKNVQLLYNVLQKKCGFKEISVPDFSAIKEHEKIDELEPQWANMLAHQLPTLPPFSSFWEELEPFFDWLQGSLNESRLSTVSKKDEQVFQPGRIASARSIDVVLQRIQFAAANRVCVNIKYHGSNRTVEPLSFRTSSTGNRLFYGYERDAGHPKAFSLDKIEHVEVTTTPYIEKYAVEISASGQIVMPPIQRSPSTGFGAPRATKVKRYSDKKHVYRCSSCGKLFYRKNRTSRLNPHKDKNGYRCPGRHGTYEGFR